MNKKTLIPGACGNFDVNDLNIKKSGEINQYG